MEEHHRHHHYGILMKSGGGGRMTSSSPSPHFLSAAATAANIPSELFGFNGFNLTPLHQHHRIQFGDQEMGFVPRGIHGLSCPDSSAAANNAGNANTTIAGSSVNGGSGGGFGVFLDSGGGGSGRWPRQETLTLLEIRSRLDHKFKEANQKGPLWDEISRIMSEEHGYHRSGKKCREKFENLYKYYRKTKEGKAGRQDGKHYRFFRQLEALYGDSNNSVSLPETQFMSNALHFHAPSNNISNDPPNVNNPEAMTNSTLHPLHPKLSIDNNSLSLSNNYNSSELETSSSDDNGNDLSTRRKRRDWKAKIKEFIDVQMKRLIERQEAWLEKLTKTIEDKEHQMMIREEEWRRQEVARIDKEHSFWAREREKMEARDVALIETLQCLTGRPLRKTDCLSPRERINGNNEIQNRSENQKENGSDQTETNNACLEGDMGGWTESEMAKLTEIRTSMESGFQHVMESGCSDKFLWEEISAKLTRLGFDERSALTCKEKWECISDCMRKANKQINKKRKEKSSSCGVYYPRADEDPMYSSHGSGYNNARTGDQMNEQGHGGSSPSNSNVGNQVGAIASNVCFPFFMGDGDQNLWESYGVRLSKGENQ